MSLGALIALVVLIVTIVVMVVSGPTLILGLIAALAVAMLLSGVSLPFGR